MTARASNAKYGRVRLTLLSLSALAAITAFGIFASAGLADSVMRGMELAVTRVLPSSFPFMILADAYTYYGRPEQIRALRLICKRVLHLPEETLGALICGNVGGFPIGARLSARLYMGGRIDKGTAERLLPLSSNPSIAFIFGGVGIGMYGSARAGTVLVISVYLSMLICAVISRGNDSKSYFNGYISEQKYNFIASVKDTASGSITMIAFISLFSAIVGALEAVARSATSVSLLYAVLEVTSAVNIFSSNTSLTLSTSLALSSFSLAFGGISVAMQSAAFISETDIGMKKYVLIKLAQAVIASLISLCISPFIIK